MRRYYVEFKILVEQTYKCEVLADTSEHVERHVVAGDTSKEVLVDEQFPYDPVNIKILGSEDVIEYTNTIKTR